MKMVLLAQQANAETRFEELVKRLNALPEMPPTAVLKLRSELASLIENVERIIKLIDEQRRPK